MTKDKALDLALEELENCADLLKVFEAPIDSCVGATMLQAEKAIKAIKQARALDKMAENARELGLDYEPVAIDANMRNVLHGALKRSGKVIPPPAQPAPAQPVQEPVAWTVSGKIIDWSKDFSAYQTKHYTRPVYTPPAANRQWVELTGEERVDLWKATETDNRMVLIDAIEAKLKERNV